MDDRPVVWDDANRKHLGEDHPERKISIEQIEEPEGRYPIHARAASKRVVRRLTEG